MKIVVAYKWARNPQDAVVDDAGEVDWARAKFAISEYDCVAMEVGRQLADACSAELIGFTVGGTDAASSLAAKAALSRGLDRLVVVGGEDRLDDLESTETAAWLAAGIAHIGGVELILTGDSSVDNGARLVPALLAGFLGWPCLLEVNEVKADAATVIVTRSISGAHETLEVPLPAVVACAPDAAVPRVPGMRDILAAGKKPAETVPAGDLAPAVVGRTEVLERRRTQTKARSGRILTGDVDAAAAELVSTLRAAAIL